MKRDHMNFSIISLSVSHNSTPKNDAQKIQNLVKIIIKINKIHAVVFCFFSKFYRQIFSFDPKVYCLWIV